MSVPAGRPPRVSVAIPTRNRAALVVQAVESVFEQTVREVEVIVVDNGSTDGTRAALAPWLDRIRFIRSERLGRSRARNLAIEAARGEIVAFLDSDDLWLPDKLARQLQAFDEHPDVGLVHGHVEVIDELGRPLPDETASTRALFTRVHRRAVTYAGYASECAALTSTVAARRSTLERVGGFDESLDALEDLDLYLQMALAAGILFLHGEPLARYRHHAGQTGDTSLARGRIAVYRKHLALLDSRSDVPDRQAARAQLLRNLADAHNVLLESRDTRTAMLAAIAAEPALALEPAVVRRLAVSLLPDTAVRWARARRGTAVGDAGASV